MDPTTPKEGNAIVTFEDEHVPDAAASKKAGRPVVKTRTLCRVRFSNNSRQESVFPAHDKCRTDPNTGGVLTYAQVYADAYARYQAMRESIGEGTLIEMAQFLTSARKAEMKAMNLHTIDALASVPLAEANKLGPKGQDEVKAAKAFMKDAASLANVRKLASENEALREANEALKTRVEDLNKQITALSAKKREAA